MSKELVIGSNRHETKVAILEEDQLVEVYFQRANEYSLAGSIHKGRVTRVLPGMQSAFVDLGLERDTFLYVSDFFEENEDIDTVVDEKPSRNDRRERSGNRGGGSERPSGQERRELDGPIAGAPEPAMALAEPPELSEGPELEGSEAEEIGASPSSLEDRHAAQAAGQTGDRPFGGDRRGRRSRRRKQRTGGIPENKYAQPGAQGTDNPGFLSRTSPGDGSSAVVGGSEPSSSASHREPIIPVARFSSHPEPAEDATEVVLLPGESLAKYRQKPLVPSPAATEEPVFFETAPEPAHDVPVLEDTREDEPLTEEELAAEADEIALTDMILSHHDDPVAEEQKLAEVQRDIPEDEPERSEVPSEFSREIATQHFEAEHVRDSNESEAVVAEQRIDFPEHEPSDTPLALAPSQASQESELLQTEEVFGDAEERSSEETFGEDPIDSEQSSEEVATGEVGEQAQEAGPQTATLREREQGGRFTHRSSRRMRRRRGGNRPIGGQDRAAAGDGRSVESASGASGASSAGAAVALEPRAETRREPAEDRSADKSVEKAERVYPSISDLLKPGQEIIVQIAKEPLGQKGARITSHIALPGRYVVFMPSVHHLGVSRKVESDEERQRLKKILQAHRVGTTGGFIVRTAGEGIPEEEIAADMNFLYSLWLDIRQKAEKKPAPALLHYDLDVVQRILRDQVTEDFKAIWVDNEDLYESVLTFMQRFQPALVNRVKMYTRPAPIFDAFNITQELEKALRPKVWLKSGGYIVINQTEALVAIDINTGKYVGKSNRLEDTIVKTNTEAVKEIVRQIRLRDLGGIIVVDFIDMDERKNRQKVMQALEEAMRADKAPYKILQFNDFGLVAITRKRVKQSLERTLCSPCPYCEGAGYVKSVQTVISEILIEAQKIARAVEGQDVVLRVHPDVAKVLKASTNQYLEETEELLGRPVLVVGDPTLHHQKFDLA